MQLDFACNSILKCHIKGAAMKINTMKATLRTKILTGALAATSAVAIIFATACGGGAAGTYSDSTGSMVLVLKSGGSATMTFAGITGDCNYTTSGSTVTLTCQNTPGAINFTLADGTLTGPPDSPFPPLKKK
jgi:hypothetical protein